MEKFKELFESSVTADELIKQASKVTSEITGKKHIWYDDSRDGEIIAATGDRVRGYDFGPELIYSPKTKTFEYFDETENGSVKGKFKNMNDLFKFFKKTLNASREK